MKRNVNLLQYYPPHLKKSRQIQEISITESPEFNLYWEKVEQARNNIYIATADNYGLSRFEKLFDLHPSPTGSLESRRKVVLALWNENVPYTLKQLEIWLTEMCGKDNFSITLNTNEYRFNVEINTEDSYIYNSAVSLIKRIIPCNLSNEFIQITQISKQIFIFKSIATTNEYLSVSNLNTFKTPIKIFTAVATTNVMQKGI